MAAKRPQNCWLALILAQSPIGRLPCDHLITLCAIYKLTTITKRKRARGRELILGIERVLPKLLSGKQG